MRSSPEAGDTAPAPAITARSVHWLAEHRTTLALHATAVLVTVFAIRVVGSGFGDGYPPFFPDSSSFAAVARRGPFTGRFWFDERPIGFPLLYWALGRSVRFVVLAQLALHIAAFGAVVALAVRTLRSVVAQLVVVVFTVALAVQPRFSLWTTHVLSESLAISTGVAAVAAWWWFATTPTRRRADRRHRRDARRSCSSRDSNAVVVAVTVLPALAVAGWRLAHRTAGRRPDAARRRRRRDRRVRLRHALAGRRRPQHLPGHQQRRRAHPARSRA